MSPMSNAAINFAPTKVLHAIDMVSQIVPKDHAGSDARDALVATSYEDFIYAADQTMLLEANTLLLDRPTHRHAFTAVLAVPQVIVLSDWLADNTDLSTEIRDDARLVRHELEAAGIVAPRIYYT